MSTTTRHSSHSRRDNGSVSSSHSAQGSRSERSSRSQANPAIESAVTRLLVSIKELLKTLTAWSTLKSTENDVSDVYVDLGNDFNAAVAAFASFNIDMSELMAVPDELRGVLEQCLAEDATPETLEIYLPDVRKIITKLLQGLRGKQSVYRQIVSDSKHRSTASDATSSVRPESRSSRRRDTANSTRTARDTVQPSDSLSRRSATSTRRKDSQGGGLPQPSSNGAEPFIGGFSFPQPLEPPGPSGLANQVIRQDGTNTPSRTPSSVSVGLPPEVPQRAQSPLIDATPIPRPPSQAPQVPSHVKRYSLVDRPISSPPPVRPAPAVIVEEAGTPDIDIPVEIHAPSPPPAPPSFLDTPPPDVPAVQSSLAALKQSDALERRASKRFSSYNISKMTSGSIRGMGNHPNRRSMAVSSALTPGDLAVLTEENEETPSPRRQRDRSKASQRSRNPSPIVEDEEAPPLPPVPIASGSTFYPSIKEDEPIAPPAVAAPSLEETQPSTLTVFLQVGREVKKVSIERGLMFASLRVLFVDKFSYSPGQDNFPAIYIRDPSSGVQYELEDMEEVKDRCLLSLNIEPLDQIKQHIDSQISTLSHDIKDLRSIMANNRRNSIPPPMIVGQALPENASQAPRPSDRQFRNVARRLSRLIPEEEMKPTPTQPESVSPQLTGASLLPQMTGMSLLPQMTGMSLQPQMTGASVMSEYSARIVTDLKNQFDEIQNLRRDLGIMRQLYTDFMNQTKESLGTLRTQTQNVRQLATAKVGGARAYINDGKTKLDTRSQNALTKIEELQDTVEAIKDDVIKRNISPRPQVFKTIKGDIDAVAAELQSLKDHIQTVKPMWKKTWEEELQNIVEEQQFLSHQEEFLGDLLEDHKAVIEVYGHVEKVISLRGGSSTKGGGSTKGRVGRTFKPVPAEEGQNGISTVMLEIRGAAIDNERRMKAIAANEKQREKELKGREDEFQSELTGFVQGKKLKMTGGAEEVERVRQKRNDTTLKAMFTGGSGVTSNPGSALPSPSGDGEMASPLSPQPPSATPQ